ncbi:hypothetical protein KFL_000030200 [Klebsormidium nitens]|uniref:RING-type domain-containing protein n=1 Tax=Klebsormidium nitens TaxID=105231 RepID=A0A1Y1HL94_KLENI|nr:hypothetical protein KFL_000030200 [Klebsormidium nitens]|eukprot:GAQ77741.1 hypothetical protein KFL_000030200 [Klebsormidium nitens]
MAERSLSEGGRRDALPSSMTPAFGMTTRNDSNAVRAPPVLLTFTVRFLDGVVVPFAMAQLVSENSMQLNQTLSDGTSSFWVDPTWTYSLFLSAEGSRMAKGPIHLRRPIIISPSNAAGFKGDIDLGSIPIDYSSFCSGAETVTGNGGGVIAGGGGGIQTLQIPGQTCTWAIGPFSNPGTIVLSLYMLDLTTGNSLTIYSIDNRNRQRVVLQVGMGYPNTFSGITTVQSLSIYDPSVIVAFSTGPGSDSLTNGFMMSYKVDRFITTGRVLALSLIWAGGGFAFLLIIFLIFTLLQRRQRRIRAGQAPPLLPWERPRPVASAEPDPLDHDVMVVKIPGEEPHRMALPQKAWQPGALKFAFQAPGSDLAKLHLDVVGNLAPPSQVQCLEEARNRDTRSTTGTQGPPSEPSILPLERDTIEDSIRGVPDVRGAWGRLLPSLSRKSISREQQAAELADRQKAADDNLSRVANPEKRVSDAHADTLERSMASETHRDDGSCGDCEACAICLVEYEEGTCLRPLPCEHAFHTACIDMWLKKDPSCPLCKRPLYTPPLPYKPAPEESPGASQRVTGYETGLGQASAQAPSSTGADDGHTSTATDLEAGPSTTPQNGLAHGLVAREVRERTEEDERAHRQRPMNPAWYLHQWLGWGW